ncbi:hypothetical protein [Peribacillus glennii]|uniref:hypothetical protein n=1 Tax=Peribacillus glennii TaxID=2303991 RepID=UPI00115E6329|nr:hypothetical protein [Peribacillus glennii]
MKNNESQPEEPKAVNNQAENQMPNKFNQPTTTKPNKAVISKPMQDDKYKAHYEAFDKWLCPHCAHQFEKQEIVIMHIISFMVRLANPSAFFSSINRSNISCMVKKSWV